MITLSTLENATAQEVFEQVKNHLLSQKVSSKSKDGGSWYRLPTEDGKVISCAAGCLISDDEYKLIGDKIEGNWWGDLVGDGIAPEKHCELIAKLQSIHDDYPP